MLKENKKKQVSSSINRSNNSFKSKEELLNIMKKTFIKEKINNENNLYKLFNKIFLNIIEPYIDEKLHEMTTLDNFKKSKVPNPFCSEDVDAEFNLEKYIKK